MQKVSLKKLSILGLVLMAASAVTAAIIPNSKSDAFATPSLTQSAGAASTASCEFTDNAATQPCKDVTATDGLNSLSTDDNGASNNTDGLTTL